VAQGLSTRAGTLGFSAGLDLGAERSGARAQRSGNSVRTCGRAFRRGSVAASCLDRAERVLHEAGLPSGASLTEPRFQLPQDPFLQVFYGRQVLVTALITTVVASLSVFRCCLLTRQSSAAVAGSGIGSS
jgi:hypothetical protein